MSYEESRQLLGDPERGSEPRRTLVWITVSLVIVVGVLGVLGAWGVQRVNASRVEAEAARADAVAARTTAIAERDAALAQVVQAEQQVLDAQVLAQAAVERTKNAIADAYEVGDLLRGVVTVWAAGTPSLPPPALHELLRGDVLLKLQSRMPRERYLELVRATVQAMARDVRPRDHARVRIDFDFAKEMLAEAQKTYEPGSVLMGDALLAVAEMCIAYQAISGLDEPARVTLQENAQTCAELAAPLLRERGGRAYARTLDLQGELARIVGDAARAVDLHIDATRALGEDADARDRATIALHLATALLDVGRRADALALLRTQGERLAAVYPFGDERELEIRTLLVSLLSTDDESAAMEQRLALGRVLAQLGRPAVAYDVLSRAVAYYKTDDTRFRERLEAILWLARAMDQTGSPEAALATLEQPRIREDARVIGEQTVLAREYAQLTASLRAKVAGRKAGE